MLRRKSNNYASSHEPYMFSAVYRQANNINMLKDGMKIEATHVKKKQLHQYLPPELVQKKKRVRYLPLKTFYGIFPPLSIFVC